MLRYLDNLILKLSLEEFSFAESNDFSFGENDLVDDDWDVVANVEEELSIPDRIIVGLMNQALDFVRSRVDREAVDAAFDSLTDTARDALIVVLTNIDENAPAIRAYVRQVLTSFVNGDFLDEIERITDNLDTEGMSEDFLEALSIFKDTMVDLYEYVRRREV